jgi:hypothetical protein
LCVIDVDGDGFGESNPSNANADAGTDCDDGNDTINPDATDIPGDGFDQDCDGADAALADVDGDGYDNSADCDDNDSNIYPTAFDIPGDGIDQDCDGSDATGSISTVADLLPGDLVITEIMVNPAVVADTDGEWFEILNTTGSIFNLNGLKLQDASMISNSTTYTINVDAYINSEDFAVFIRNTDASSNGGIQNGINFGSVTLNNTGTETLRILGGASGTTTIDEFSWDAAQMNFIEGVSIMFDGDELANMTNLSDAANMNDDGDKWCHTVIPYGDGDNKGTPKNYNNSCTNIPVDNDGDGYYQNAFYQEDCDDSTTTNLGQTEVDGYYTYPGAAYRDSFTECMTDVDGDGYGDDSPASNVTPGSDCDDGDNTTNPASTDVAKDCNPNTP